ncbi:uncharacterized protein LOC108099386 [Drosophila ficusphila]|uniref:uncharacterized protein LOC108099386 n=1 Tax=Drosophila ficusphila TaxID=30025 RepID=UPI0007E64FC1|nr:uncharacterized protein LOC108099386 [Drosophila ficusphila]
MQTHTEDPHTGSGKSPLTAFMMTKESDAYLNAFESIYASVTFRNSNTTDAMKSCIFCLTLCTTIGFLIGSELIKQRDYSSHSKDIGSTIRIDNNKVLYSVLGTPFEIAENKVQKRIRVKRTSFGGRIYYNHRGNPMTGKKIRMKVQPKVEYTRTERNWLWNLFA